MERKDRRDHFIFTKGNEGNEGSGQDALCFVSLVAFCFIWDTRISATLSLTQICRPRDSRTFGKADTEEGTVMLNGINQVGTQGAIANRRDGGASTHTRLFICWSPRAKIPTTPMARNLTRVGIARLGDGLTLKPAWIRRQVEKPPAPHLKK
jgi:hypothetical protein